MTDSGFEYIEWLRTRGLSETIEILCKASGIRNLSINGALVFRGNENIE